MRYEGSIFRPPSEAHSYLLQATIGCSWNQCVYCAMYREKTFRVRDLDETLADIDIAARQYGTTVEKVFVCDGDALVMPMDHWEPILLRLRAHFPRLRRVSCYAMAWNVLDKTDDELRRLRELGLSLLYLGPESGDEPTMRWIAKSPLTALPGDGRHGTPIFDAHVHAAAKARAAGLKTSAIFLLGAGGLERSDEHAAGSAALASAMDPDFLAALTLTIVPGTPLAKRHAAGKFVLPDVAGLLGELRTFVAEAKPTDALFRTNHASNYLPLGGRLPTDGPAMAAAIDAALDGRIPLRDERTRGL
jgi:radical SAM superfamily enzyme YgiQ (UPF0313 family)